jgi:O-antigen/teichoic acid export membrane protein
MDGTRPVRTRPTGDMPNPNGVARKHMQEAGIAALVAIAQSSTATVPIPVLRPNSYYQTEISPSPSDTNGPPIRSVRPRSTPDQPQSRWRQLQARLRADHMVRNSLYLILSSGLQAALGAAFWIITARLFSAAAVGTASSLISATTLIAYISLLGLNSTFVRYLPTAQDRNALLTAGFLLVAACGAGIGVVYVLLTPILAPRLAFIGHQPALAAGFVLLTAAAAVNLLTDSVFIASRRAGYNALTDGGIGGLIKIFSGLILVGTGGYGLFCASVGGFAAAALASLVLMTTALHWRPSFRNPVSVLKPVFRFSMANYAGNVLDMAPSMLVPVIVLDRLGASEAGYYFVAFQVATILYAGVSAVVQVLLAEGSYDGADWRRLIKRSWRLLMVMCLPACLLLILGGHWLLLAFGPEYSEQGTRALMLLAIATIPIAANNWLWTVLRLAGRLRAIIVSSCVYAFAICSLAWLLAPHGLAALACAWPLGALCGTLAAGPPRGAPARHKRTAGTAHPTGKASNSHRYRAVPG